MRIRGWQAFTLAVSIWAVPATAQDELSGEDYRYFCGYLDALEKPKIKKLKRERSKEKKIARMAKTSRKKLMASVERAQVHGATCDEVGKVFEAKAMAAVNKALPGRILASGIDFSDPSHVVAYATWRSGDKKKIPQEASLLAAVLHETAPISKTIGIAATKPGAKDPDKDEDTIFRAVIATARAARIDKARIKDFALSRYLRLFEVKVDKVAKR